MSGTEKLREETFYTGTKNLHEVNFQTGWKNLFEKKYINILKRSYMRKTSWQEQRKVSRAYKYKDWQTHKYSSIPLNQRVIHKSASMESYPRTMPINQDHLQIQYNRFMCASHFVFPRYVLMSPTFNDTYVLRHRGVARQSITKNGCKF